MTVTTLVMGRQGVWAARATPERVKQADPQGNPDVPLVLSRQEAADAAQGHALRDILAVSGAAALGGVGVRALLARKYLFGRGSPDVGQPRVSAVPIPEPVQTRRRKKPLATRGPAPALPDPAVGYGTGPDYGSDYEARGQAKAALDEGPATRGFLSGIAHNDNALDKHDVWYYMPGLVGGGLAGAMGGYKLMDLLMDRKRKKDLSQEVQDSRDDYRQALTQQYQPGHKAASQSPAALLGQDLDRLAQLAEGPGPSTKSASLTDWLGRMGQRGLGAYGAVALPAALLTGLGVYNYTSDTSTQKLVEEAVRMRRRKELERRPPEIYAVPESVPVDSRGRIKHPLEDEE